MSQATAQHDRMLAGLIIPCRVVGVDLAAAMVRVSDGSDWTSTWVRWHSQAAGKARHWRAPSLGEQGALISPSGEPAQGTFVSGLYGNAGAQPDNRDHVEVWRFDDGGSLVYDWQANTYMITLPTGQVLVKVGSSTFSVTDNAISGESATINFKGAVSIDGPLHVTQNITGDGSIIDSGGNSNHHTH
ncbi:phage baseplate assembly protein V [Pseudomonas putida]|uniref:phage baseplate assembly protein V n=1 Tax=Pseudomonas putida TaxID=303 RepID=UPI003D98A6E3